jgi:FtsZ-binding cell division protein ZapB
MTTQNALEAIGVSVDGVSKETLVAIVRRLQAENERLRENAKTISELEQLAARSNNDLLVENERLRKDAERYRWLSDDGGIHSLPYDDFGCGPVFDLSRDTIDAARGGK